MTERVAKSFAFLSGSKWVSASRTLVAGDASNRKYDRLTLEATGETAILMDAPSEKGEDVRPFVAVAQHLRGQGLSAPEILLVDEINGFLLLEDLGDDLFARVVAARPTLELTLYEAATDVLLKLHRAPLAHGLKPYSLDNMVEMAALSYHWYLGGIDAVDETATNAFIRAFRPVLETHASDQTVLIQRDYHAENLLWLPARNGVERVGLLDFQDAMIGHPAYDLVSILQDARRDVPLTVEADMIARYIEATHSDPAQFHAAYNVLGAQRNLRILGAFGRLCIASGKAHYVDLIPRVWGLLMRDLAHPALADIREIILRDLPEPTPNNLKLLKEKCARLPKQ